MEIEAAKKLKTELETKICDLMNEFTAKTGIELEGMKRISEKKEEKTDLVIFETHDCRSVMTREEAEDKAHTEARYFAVASLITKHQKELEDLWDEAYEKLKKVRITPVEKI